MSMTSDRRNDFLSWLSRNNDQGKVSRYEALMDELNLYCQKKRLIQQKLYEISDVATIRCLCATLQGNRLFRFFKLGVSEEKLEALRLYADFLEKYQKEKDQKEEPSIPSTVDAIQDASNQAENCSIPPIKPIRQQTAETHANVSDAVAPIQSHDPEPNVPTFAPPQPEKPAELEPQPDAATVEPLQPNIKQSGTLRKTDLSRDNNFSFCTISYIEIEGERFNAPRTWKAAYQWGMNWLLHNRPSAFLQEEYRWRFSGSSSLTTCKLDNGTVVCTNYSTTDLLKRFSTACKLCGVSPDRVVIGYTGQGDKAVEEKPQIQATSQDDITLPENILETDLSRNNNFSFCSISYIEIEGERLNAPRSWRTAYQWGMNWLLRNHTSAFLREDYRWVANTRTAYATCMLENGTEIYANYSATGLMKQLGLACMLCGTVPERVFIGYTDHRDAEVDKPDASQTALPATDREVEQKTGPLSQDDFDAMLQKVVQMTSEDDADKPQDQHDERWKRLLEEGFPEGYICDDFICRMQAAMKWEALYGESCPLEGASIDQAIRAVGVQQGERIVPRSEDASRLLDEICGVISGLLREYTCVYPTRIYERYQVKLAEQGIYNVQDMVSSLEQRHNGAFRRAYGVFSRVNGLPSIAQDCQKTMRAHGGIMTRDELQSALWFIPPEGITSGIKGSPDMLHIGTGKWMLAEFAPINERDANDIADRVIRPELMYHPFIRTSELKGMIERDMPSLGTNISDLDSAALNSILKYYLSDTYRFTATMVSRVEARLSAADLFSDFVSSYERFTLQELEAFAKENGAKIINWDAIFDGAIRINQDEFVNKQTFHFDVEGIDDALDAMCPGQYMPLKQLPDYLLTHLPPCGSPWNSYLLFGYLLGYSQRFGVCYRSFSKTGCFGAMVRKNVGIQDYDGLIERVLTDNTEWKNAADAMKLLISEGYQERSRYSGLEAIMNRVMANRR